MALSFSFQMTPRQTEFLLVVAYGHYRDIRNPNSIGAEPCWLPEFEHSSFVQVAHKLIEKGFVTHDQNRTPTYLVTDMGKQFAEHVIRDAKRLIAFEENKKPIPKVVARKVCK